MPVITLASLEIVFLLSGIGIMELVFGIPGLGSLLLEGVKNRDGNETLECIFGFHAYWRIWRSPFQ